MDDARSIDADPMVVSAELPDDNSNNPQYVPFCSASVVHISYL